MIPARARAIGMLLAFSLACGESGYAQDGPRQGEPKRPVAALNTIADVFHALESCWDPPNLDHARPGMQITVLLSFKRSGELNGKPRITFETPDATEQERLAYRIAMARALERCKALAFTQALGNALAGRTMTIRFIDNRNLKQASRQDGRAS